MVSRKNVSSNGDASTNSQTPDPPYQYPLAPPPSNPPSWVPDRGSSLPHASLVVPTSDSQAVWGDADSDNSFESRPSSIHAGYGSRVTDKPPQIGPMDLPESLRIGPPGFTPRSSEEIQRPLKESTNPYIRKQLTGQSTKSNNNIKESSVGAWESQADRPAPPLTAPPPPPVPKDSPVRQFSSLNISEPSGNPWQPSLDTKLLPKIPAIPTIQRQDSEEEAWSSNTPPLKHASAMPPLGTLIPIESDESPAWDEEGYDDGTTHETPADEFGNFHSALALDREAWADNSGQMREAEAAVPSDRAVHEGLIRSQQSWNYTERLLPQQSGIIQRDVSELEAPPGLPPRPSQENGRQLASAINPVQRSASNLSATGTTESASRRQKTETYEIKKIAWYDANAVENPRISPILVQNANGPCPLLALVNALTLSTPAELNTALVDTLRSREQVSLGLLLDAVFDELMSGRRGDAVQELPDVSDLYSFLVTLHTGMNVNPRFFPPPPTNLMDDPRRSMSHVHPTEREDSIPGTFEETREMKLYSTFSVPLIHGWLPYKGSPEYLALSRSAKSYEDAQNLMFREEELEYKSQREGLSFEEQATAEDIVTIKSFFVSSATQLTDHGLDTIMKSLTPGSVAILFRNDHFSTLYKHPESHQLLSLVTDMGYAGHEEIVWESLTDINGENCEFFSGDFRLVGGSSSPRQSIDTGAGWTTVERTSNQRSQRTPTANVDVALINQSTNLFEPISRTAATTTEQEDHDLALAIQLQEEEEERDRNERAARRRESELSQQFIEQQATQTGNVPVSAARGGGRSRGRGASSISEVRPVIPPRRNNASVTNVASVAAAPRPIPVVVDPEAGVDAPPPSYEQAATQQPYNPPINHPAHPSASPVGSMSAPAPAPAPASRRRNGAYTENRAGMGAVPQQVPVRPLVQTGRRTSGLTSGQDRDKECVIM